MKVILLTIALLVTVQNGKVQAASDRSNFHGGYVDASGEGFVLAAAGQKSSNPDKGQEQQVLFVRAGDQQTDFSGKVGLFEVGVHRSASKTPDVFNSGSRRDADHETKFLTAGVEGGYGLMGRAAVVEATVNTGHVGFSTGVGFDTGAIFNDGVEAKFLGIGGKVGKHGMQVCFVFCLGFNW